MTSEYLRRRSTHRRMPWVILSAVAVVAMFAACGKSETATTSAAKKSPGSPSVSVAEQSQAPATITGTVEYVEGKVTINGVATDIGASVKSGDTITTGNNGVCNIVFLRRNIVQIQPDSVAVINFGEIGRGIQLESGSLAAVLKNLTQTTSGSRFQVDTPTMVAGVRGTTFYVKVLNINSTYFCLCNGEIHLQDNGGEHKMTLEAAHHTAVEYMREEGVISVAKRPMLYHTDAQMQALAKKIGYTINWKKPDLVN